MSKQTDQFEEDIVAAILASNTNYLPRKLPQWMQDVGIKPGARIMYVNRIGASNSKTDVLVQLQDSANLKISAKLSSADYFGNWYSHTRIIEEFGEEAFHKLVKDCTNWANKWKLNKAASLFVGVSICFGKRSGNTAREFTDVFNYEDIVKIVAGVGNNDQVANSLYVSSKVPNSLEELIENLAPIDESTILKLSSNFKIAYRPINPMTEGTNRGKCIYTQFKPYQRSDQLTVITELSDLNQLGQYITVENNSLNHNRLLNELESDWNIIIPRKP